MLIVRALPALALLMACGVALSQPPSPGGRKHVQKQSAQASAATSQSAPEQRGTASAPIFVQGIPAADSASDAAHKEYEHHEKPTLDRWLTYATVALAVFTLLLFIFTAALWWVTLQLSRRARTEGERQAIDTQLSLTIATDAAKTAIAAERAYVFPAAIILEADGIVGSNSEDRRPKRHIQVRIRLRNHGKTPAAISEILADVKLLRGKPILESMRTVPLTWRFISLDDSEPIDPIESDVLEDEYQLARTGKEFNLFCLGHIAYLDVFKKPHYTLFAWEWDFSAKVFRPSVDPTANDWN